MSAQPQVQVHHSPEIARSYPPAAYAFLLEGLNFAVEKIHGPMSEPAETVAKYMVAESLDLQELWERREAGALAPEVCQAIEDAGGIERLNRHVSGQDLCWALRDWAVARWGFLAPVVLGTWNVTRTIDLGNLVFDLIEHGRLQKEPQDHIDDFRNVFDFQDAFDRAYRVEFSG